MALWIELWIELWIFFSSRRRNTRWNCDWSSDVCSSDLVQQLLPAGDENNRERENQQFGLPKKIRRSRNAIPEIACIKTNQPRAKTKINYSLSFFEPDEIEKYH